MKYQLWNRLRIFLLIVGIVLLLSFSALADNRACYSETCFTVEIASTPEQQARGLMLRKQLDRDKGMLFVFEREERHAFWMKNTLIPLDIIWLDKDRSVVFIHRNAQPCREDYCPQISPEKEALFVVELNAGSVDTLGLKTGDTMEFFQ
ncbi:DUF192 domain-containing protein [Candidatus Omnitrophota bacterium]